jgi:MFS transporter, putative metabolite:H+ symporter
MFDLLDRQEKLTRNQKRMIVVATTANMLDFYDYYAVGFVLAFLVKPWGLTFGQSAIVLLSSGLGAMFGAFVWGWAADRIGRRRVLAATITMFSIATGALALTPDRGWIYLALVRFLVGFGAGGFYCVDLPLVQEFAPTRLRGRIAGFVTSSVPAGLLLAALAAATLTPMIGWRGLFVIGMILGLAVLLVLAWVPESPRWLWSQGRLEEARESIAWALEINPQSIPSPAAAPSQAPASLGDLFRYPRSLAVSWMSNLGIQTGNYGMTMWAPTLLVLVLKISPATASWYMIPVGLAGLGGRLFYSILSDRLGRRPTGVLFGLGAALSLIATALLDAAFVGPISLFWILLAVTNFSVDGGFAIVGPYASEVWPSRLRATGMGAAYGFGGLGKILGPLGLAVIVGSSNLVTPQATLAAILPAFVFLASCFVLAAAAFLLFGIETRGKSLERLDEEFERPPRKPIADALPHRSI